MSLACFRSLVAAGWSLLLCDCWLVVCFGTLFEPQGGLGELWEVSGMAPGGPEQVPGRFMKAVGGVGQPMNDLSLRFHMFLRHRML